MQVICLDGTVLQCDRFEAIDSGVLLFDEQERRGAEEGEDDEDEEEMADEASAFVPIHQLRFVLPDGAQANRATGQSMGQTVPQPPAQAPPTGGTTTPQEQMPPQQSPTGQPAPRRNGPGQGTGPGQGRR